MQNRGYVALLMQLPKLLDVWLFAPEMFVSPLPLMQIIMCISKFHGLVWMHNLKLEWDFKVWKIKHFFKCRKIAKHERIQGSKNIFANLSIPTHFENFLFYFSRSRLFYSWNNNKTLNIWRKTSTSINGNPKRFLKDSSMHKQPGNTVRHYS